MRKKLNAREYLAVAIMLFGMFFGAGNLIFPVFMGWQAGRNVWGAILGFIVTGVGLPLMGVAAIGISRSDGLVELSGKVSRPYSVFFTCALYLTIGPCFAIPRCAATPFTVVVSGLMSGVNERLALLIFSAVFFALVLAFSIKPGKILTYVGKILTPAFLLFLAVLVVTALVRPVASLSQMEPAEAYRGKQFVQGFLDGYNTMDALACLAFGIVVVNVIRSLGVGKPEHVAVCTAKAGIFSCLIMAAIYVAVTLAGAQIAGLGGQCANGGEVLALIAKHYFGKVGAWLLAATVTLACLKTSVGLVVSCGETFCAMFQRGPKYRVWAVIFSAASFLIANLGLNSIVAYSLPVLMLLYPLAITLILLGLFGGLFGHDRRVYISVTACTAVAAIFDFLKALPEGVRAALHLQPVLDAVNRILPLHDLGVGWLLPAALGLLIGLALRWLHIAEPKQTNAA